MNEQDKWLEDQKSKHEKEISKVSYAKERYDICKSCEYYMEKVLLCKVCYCFLPGKTRLKGSYCPIGKWDSINETKDD